MDHLRIPRPTNIRDGANQERFRSDFADHPLDLIDGVEPSGFGHDRHWRPIDQATDRRSHETTQSQIVTPFSRR